MKKGKFSYFILLITLTFATPFASKNACAKNLHRIDPPDPSEDLSKRVERRTKKHKDQVSLVPTPAAADPGFAMYRTGQPQTLEEYDEMVCDKGIQEIWVLSNNKSVEDNFGNQKGRRCTAKLVTKNFDQSVSKGPLTKAFLDKFDAWVDDARKTGKKIAFRCLCGCHRTGRLAAYYEMKYMGKTPDQAMDHVFQFSHGGHDAIGKTAYWLAPIVGVGHKLNKNIDGLYDYLKTGKDKYTDANCTVRSKFCVDLKGETGENIAEDKSKTDEDDIQMLAKQTSGANSAGENNLTQPGKDPKTGADKTNRKPAVEATGVK